MYGTRDAAAAWEREWTKTLNSVGFESGVSHPALLHCEKLDAFMVVHGDDFMTLGDDEASMVSIRTVLFVIFDSRRRTSTVIRYVKIDDCDARLTVRAMEKDASENPMRATDVDRLVFERPC